jgi:hypothetical protein
VWQLRTACVESAESTIAASTESAAATMAASSACAGSLSLGASGAYTWKVTSLSTQTEASSPSFTVGGIEWQIEVYPKGHGDGAGSHLSLFLQMVDGANQPWGWSCPASVTLAVKLQTEACHNVSRVFHRAFDRLNTDSGYPQVRSQRDHRVVRSGRVPTDACWMQSCLGTLILPCTAGAPRLCMCHVLPLKCGGCGMNGVCSSSL